MPNRCFSFLRRQDQLGHGVTFNYKGESGYGTGLGGLLSLTTTIFFALFIAIQLYAWLFKADYNQELSVKYLPRTNTNPYSIPTQMFLPTFVIIEDVFGEGGEFNNEDNWTWYWAQVRDAQVAEYYEAVNCLDYVNSWTSVTEKERQSILDEIGDPQFTLCPDVSEFEVLGGAFATDYLQLSIVPTAQAWENNGVIINQAGVYLAEVTRYFNADEYLDNGYQDAVTLSAEVIPLSSLVTKYLSKEISKTEIDFFTFKWLDTSAITIFNFATSFTNYQVEKTSSRVIGIDQDNPVDEIVLYVEYDQSRVINSATWSVQSLDIVLGLVGGLSGIVWGVLALVLGGYQSFKFENSLIGGVYPTSPQDFSAASEEPQAKSAMMRTVAERGKYWYAYSEYLCVSLMRSFCCCLCSNSSWYKEKIKRLERHEAASEKLADEVDIVKLLYVQRVGQFIAKLILKKHQRALVTSFKKYQIDDLGQSAKESSETTQQTLLSPAIQEDGTISDFDAYAGNELLTEDQLKLLKEISDQFSPEDSAADLSILYEVTGFQAESQNFEYWENYQDFEELGETKLTRQDKDEHLIAKPNAQGKKKVAPDDPDP